MRDELTISLTLVAIVIILSIIFTFILIRRQQNKELDKSPGRAVVKHPVLANPVHYLIFLVFPAAIVVGIAVILYLYNR